MNDYELLKKELADLRQEFNNLKSTATIPYDVDQAFRDRLLKDVLISVSSKGVNTEDVTVVSSVNFVAESVGTTSVLDDPDAFLQITLNGTVYYIPVYTS